MPKTSKNPLTAAKESDQLLVRSRQPQTLVEFFRKSPLVGVELDLQRDRRPARRFKTAGNPQPRLV
jgi:hypothetical protein